MVLKEVPDGCTVVGIPGTIVRRNGEPVSDLNQVDLPDPIAVELECLRRRVVELEAIIKANLGIEEKIQCEEDCQYANILKEMEEGTLNQIYGETQIREKQAEEEREEDENHESI